MMATSHYDPTQNAIPKEINFIWIGGPIPEKYLRTIRNVTEIAKKSGFVVNLWVDHYSNYLKTAHDMGIDIEPDLKIQNISSIIELMKNDSFFMENAPDTKRPRYLILEEYINREMVGNHNYAAAADMLRYIILYLRGGHYLDADTKISLSKGSRFKLNEAEDGFLFQMNADGMGNDILASSPKHPIFKFTLDQVIIEYHQLDATNGMKSKREHKANYPKGRNDYNRLTLTIKSSGPGALGRGVMAYVYHKNSDGEEYDLSKLALKSDDSGKWVNFAGVKVKSAHDNNWLNAKRAKFGLKDIGRDLINILKSVPDAELQKLQSMLRFSLADILNDGFKKYISSSESPSLSSEKIERFINKNYNEIIDKLQIVLLTYLFDPLSMKLLNLDITEFEKDPSVFLKKYSDSVAKLKSKSAEMQIRWDTFSNLKKIYSKYSDIFDLRDAVSDETHDELKKVRKALCDEPKNKNSSQAMQSGFFKMENPSPPSFEEPPMRLPDKGRIKQS